MPIGRRLSTLLVVLALVAAPAIVLRLFCVGRSCDAGEAEAQASVPFCPLPPELRRQIAAGFREGRSPDVMAVTNGVDAVATEIHDSLWAPWPGAGSAGAAAALPDTRVPIAFFGGGVNEGSIPDGVGLDAIAPTLEAIAGIHREHPDVRTGVAIEGLADGAGSPLIVLIAWKGIGTTDLGSGPGAWRFLRGALRAGAGTLDA
ncbi:MAG: hypothetical protein ACXWZF_12575, partial [Actinomycetota bacterium]